MRLPVDTASVRFVTAGAPEPDIDYETKAAKTDDTGAPVYKVHLFVVGAGGRDVITVRVTGQPKNLGEFTPVTVTDLVVSSWTMGERSGVSFRAAKIEAATTAKAAS